MIVKKLFVMLLACFVFCTAHPSAAAEVSPGTGAAVGPAQEENFIAHFSGHFVSRIDFGTAVDVAKKLFANEPSSWWEKGLKMIGMGRKSIPELLSDGLSWENLSKVFATLKDALPQEQFETIVQDLLHCPRCAEFTKQYVDLLGVTASDGVRQTAGISSGSVSADVQQPVAPVSGDNAQEKGFFSHFCGHFTSAWIRDTSTDVPGLWEKLKKAGVFILESVPAVFAGDLGLTVLLMKLWDILPKEYFKLLMRELLACPRCRGFAYDFTVGLGASAWEKMKAGGSWVGDKAISFKDWIMSDDEPEKPEQAPQQPAEQKPGFWSAAADTVSGWGSSLWQNTKKGGSWLKDKTVSAGETLGNWGSSLWQGTKRGGSWLKNKAGSAWDSVTDGISAGWKWIFN